MVTSNFMILPLMEVSVKSGEGQPLLRLHDYPIDEGVVGLLLVSGSVDVLVEKEAAVYREWAHDTAFHQYGIPLRVGRTPVYRVRICG